MKKYMKNLSVFIVLLLFISCSSDEQVTNNTNNNLLKKIIKYSYTNFGTEIFKYNEKTIYYTTDNKIDKVKVEYFPPILSSGITTIKYYYSGDLIVSKIRFVEDNPSPQGEYYFEYDNQNRIVKFKRNYLYREQYTYQYLPDNEILVTKFLHNGLDYIPNGTYNFTLDQNQNISEYINNLESVTNLYDNKISVINGIIGLDKLYFVEQYNDDEFNFSYFNNIISKDGIDNFGNDFHQTYSYEYNGDNKPVKKYIDNKLYYEYEY